MQLRQTAIKDVLLFEPKVFTDERGFFYESFNQSVFSQLIGTQICFAQDNHVYSKKNVLRGLHYQIKQAQAKLVRVIAGEVFDVAVDLRNYSATFGQWVGVKLSAKNKAQLWIPAGFAHGCFVLSDDAELSYKTTDYWNLDYERCIVWNDKCLNIKWPISELPILSGKDQRGNLFKDAEVFQDRL